LERVHGGVVGEGGGLAKKVKSHTVWSGRWGGKPRVMRKNKNQNGAELARAPWPHGQKKKIKPEKGVRKQARAAPDKKRAFWEV